jgi:hypothetical protein
MEETFHALTDEYQKSEDAENGAKWKDRTLNTRKDKNEPVANTPRDEAPGEYDANGDA